MTLPNDSAMTADDLRTAIEAVVAGVPGAVVNVHSIARFPRAKPLETPR